MSARYRNVAIERANISAEHLSSTRISGTALNLIPDAKSVARSSTIIRLVRLVGAEMLTGAIDATNLVQIFIQL